MNIGIVGSRKYEDADFLFRQLDSYIEREMLDGKDITIISGGASGADALAKSYAHTWNLKFKAHVAD